MPGLHLTSYGPAGAPRVVALHGFMGQGSDWHAFAQRLSDRYRIDLVDLPGHGQSRNLPEACYQWAGALRLLHDITRDAQGLLGYSMGGRLALATALTGPAKLKAVVIVSATAGWEEESDRVRRCAVDDQRAHALEDTGPGLFLETWYDQPVFSSLQQQPGLKAELMARRGQSGDGREWARALRSFSAGRQPSYWSALAELAVPALFVAGELDPLYVAHARRAASLSPLGSAFIVPGCGHLPHEEARETTLQGIVDFIQEHLE